MHPKPFFIALLATACIAAAAGGAYFATRGSSPVAAPATAAVDPVPAPASSGGVSETEGLVVEAPESGSDALALQPDVETATAAPAPRVERVAPRAAKPPVQRDVRAAAPPRPSTVAREPARQSRAADQPAAPAPAEQQPWGADTARDEPDVDTLEPERAAPARTVEELVVSANSVLGLQLESTVSSETARLEDRVNARVTRDVMVGSEVAIPAGSRAVGAITTVERGGKVREKARLGVRFHTLVLADGSTLPIRTEVLMREGDSPAGESASKIGGAAVGGAILGAILGGKRGAILGGTAGAAGGTAAVMAGGRNAAVLESGSPVTVRLTDPVTVTVEK